MSKLFATIVWGLAVIAGLAGAQEDFKLTVTKVELISFNPDFIKDPKYTVFQYNATHQGINASGALLQDLGFELKEIVEIYGVEDGEAHLISTMNDVNVCEILTSGYPELEELFKIGNFTKCPMKAGFYGITNGVVDLSNIPPSIPRGDFMIDIRTFNATTLLIHTKSWVTVEDRPAKTK